MTVPLIGITAGRINRDIESFGPPVQGQADTYKDAVERAGGAAIIIPITDNDVYLRRIYGTLDGLLLAGGNDIDPSLYGEMPYKETDVDCSRDNAEMKLVQWALGEIPVLGICRGGQLMNIARGGSLYQDIGTDLPDASDHTLSTKRGSLVDIAHELKVKSGSMLAEIIEDTTIGTNTHHHQAVRDLGRGLIANAWSEDGLIEGIELVESGWGIGIQSHPESLEAVKEIKWQKIFEAFIKAAIKDYEIEQSPASNRVLTALMSR